MLLRFLKTCLKKLRHTKSDRYAWPLLPQEMLERRRDYGEQYRIRQDEQYRIMKEMSLKELMSYVRIRGKPENEWTRHEHQFVENMLARAPSTRVLDEHD